jgi:hypothetical protein
MSTPFDALELRKLLRYEPETGFLYWLPRPVSMFTCKCSQHRWNMRFAGQQALTAKMEAGYLKGTILNRQILAHRAVWAFVNGEWPQHQIDHIDGNRENNRIENLRDVPEVLNHRNIARKRKTTAPYNGVTQDKRTGRWVARIHYDGLSRHVGVFDTLYEAIRARRVAEAENGFHANHGRSSGMPS